MPFQILRNDITKVKADAIVSAINTPNTPNTLTTPNKSIASNLANPNIAVGKVTITKAFDLDAKYMIHASIPQWTDGSKGEEECLRSCYRMALQLAKKRRCKSIAFPLLSAGVYGFPKELGIQIAVDTFTDFLKDHDIEITLAIFGNEDVNISGKMLEDVAGFVEEEASFNAAPLEEASFNAAPLEEAFFDAEPFEESALDAGPLDKAPFNALPFEKAPSARTPEMPRPLQAPSAIKPESLEDALKKIYTDSFEKHLQQLINKKGLKNSEVYAAANISKQYFSKLLKGRVKPSKEKVLALAVGLRLNLDETIDFLRIAGYALSPISQTDKIVEYFIEHEDYNVLKIDIVLFDYGLDPLSNQSV